MLHPELVESTFKETLTRCSTLGARLEQVGADSYVLLEDPGSRFRIREK